MRFDFTARYIAAFGFLPANFTSPKVNKSPAVYYDDSDLGGNIDVLLNDPNTSLEDVELYHGTESYRFAFQSINDECPDILATAPMLSLKRAKKLVITAINNSDFVVVERYATEPYEITWRGLLIDMYNHRFPMNKLQKMNEIFEHNSVWGVSSQILQAIKVNSIFIKDINFDFVEGYEDTVSYSMTTQGIRPLEYGLIN